MDNRLIGHTRRRAHGLAFAIAVIFSGLGGTDAAGQPRGVARSTTAVNGIVLGFVIGPSFRVGERSRNLTPHFDTLVGYEIGLGKLSLAPLLWLRLRVGDVVRGDTVEGSVLAIAGIEARLRMTTASGWLSPWIGGRVGGGGDVGFAAAGRGGLLLNIVDAFGLGVSTGIAREGRTMFDVGLELRGKIPL